MEKSPNEEEEKLEIFEVPSQSLPEKSNLKGDWLNFFLLILLYTIQGLPLGLAIALPIIFQSKKIVSYKEQAFFSLVAWPYSVKILWAPIVDSLYVQWIGRRKSWLMFVQYLMGVVLLYTAINIDEWLPDSEIPNLKALVSTFCVISFLAATQDIVVDGWALTMLKKNNVGHASTCNGTGVALGVLIGTICPVLLTSEDFCNKYLRITLSTGGIITIKGFLYFWSFIIMLITTFIGIFKREMDNRLEEGHVQINVFKSYKLLWRIFKLPNIRVLAVALLTMKIGFSATDSVSKLKLIDAGVSKDDIMIITISMYIVKFIVPIVVSKYTSGTKPMSAYLNLMPIRLLWSIAYVVLIYYTPILIKNNGVVNVPTYYYLILVFISIIHEILAYTMYLFTLGFFSRISDSRFGGTYMTMLSTIASFGWVVSHTLALRMIDVLTFSKCSNDDENNCSTTDLRNMCKIKGGDCNIIVNGYYIEVALCMAIGFVWYFLYKKTIQNLQTKSLSNWQLNLNRLEREKNEES
ncbi:acetyl-coenzyme A transporter 1-like [Metopolophium dirhodum]|uniref:acetyl-coenzyme A transporter 1-like n=1 Tax=Metopolophium dirhodum TaxID=44670 RepID=UPI00298F415E|nr:acetyl-coenzyme A transporter 1-like [Metopolophium dirhodum]XP_060865230.1 acetyl-coenzyme A transporter 1-like [Metopolophium dirhodum]XP_060865231.1 acetyl-coenzyme A transporter 1-like [Metopolophium dirhodum]XP_060865232.1 acetyl-coenzyme A transporter 1-like [Metopolophium dirhodum]